MKTRNRLKIVPLLLSLFFASFQALPYSFQETLYSVINVIDGDTIDVMMDDQKTRIRLFGIDAPEKAQPFGGTAQELLRSLVGKEKVTIVPHTRDRYGRLVAEVYLESGQSVSSEMVAEGLAWWHEKYAPTNSELKNLQEKARSAGRGLWSEKNPTPPWQWSAEGN